MKHRAVCLAHTAIRRFSAAGLTCFAFFLLTAPALAGTTGGTAMPWETPLQTVEASLSGPVAKAVGIIAIVVTGLGFAFAEGGSVMRRGIGIVFGLAIAFTATTFITSFFNVTSGAVF
jgi:type IV secretion system protein VirB2